MWVPGTCRLRRSARSRAIRPPPPPAVPRLLAEDGTMEEPLVTVASRASRAQLLVMVGPDEVMRARLPRLDQVRQEQAVTRLLEGLSLWLNQRLCVALSADESEDYFRLDLTDELGVGARSVYYAVEVVE